MDLNLLHKTPSLVRHAVLILAAALLAGCGSSDEPAAEPRRAYDVQVNLSTNRITIGDVVTATIDAVHPDGVRVQFPELDRGKEILVRHRAFSDPVPLAEGDPGLLVSQVRYDLTSFRIGQFNLSTNTIHFNGPDGLHHTTDFPETLLDVYSTLTSTNAPLQAMQDVVELPPRMPTWLKAFLIVALLALLAAALMARLFKSKGKDDETPAPVIVPAHIKALLALDRLEQSSYISEHAIEPFYVELSAIVRHYIEDRFQLKAPERTTEEFIREATASALLHTDHQELTRRFLEQSDLVKFARHDPTSEDMQQGLAAARKLVEETRETEVPA